MIPRIENKRQWGQRGQMGKDGPCSSLGLTQSLPGAWVYKELVASGHRNSGAGPSGRPGPFQADPASYVEAPSHIWCYRHWKKAPTLRTSGSFRITSLTHESHIPNVTLSGNSPEESLLHIGKVGEESAWGRAVPRASTLFINPFEVPSFSVNVSSGTHINSGAWIKHWEGGLEEIN